jgi:hypothetical protein
VILGGRSGSEALTDWATRELEGYLGYEGELPHYRVIYAPLMVDGATMTGMVQHQQIPQASIPEFAREYVTERVELRHGAGELEALLLQDDTRLMPHGASDVARLTKLEGPPGQHIISLYWSVAPGAIRGVLDQIRMATTKLVAELRRTMPAEQDVPTREQADRAVVFIITGERAVPLQRRDRIRRRRISLGRTSDRRGSDRDRHGLRSRSRAHPAARGARVAP